MDALLLWLGRVAGFGGLLLCAVAVVMRLAGNYYLGSFQLMTLMAGGAVAVVVGCFLLLLVLTAQARGGHPSAPRQ